jgi:hypothetical protein
MFTVRGLVFGTIGSRLVNVLIISRGDGLIGTLLNCTPKGHEFGIYEARWLQESEEAFAPWATQECFKDYDTGAIESDFVKMLGQNFTPEGPTRFV